MIKAFLSHASTDKDLVELVHEKLVASNVWYDAVNIENGENIPEQINEGLSIATHYVLFWSERAKNSSWVKAELNAAFVRLLASKCKLLIFCLDNADLPELLQPYKYDKVDKTDLQYAAQFIADTIMKDGGSDTRLSEFINRTKEIGEIEEAARAGYKLIILNGILGIGKSSIAERALHWLYPNRATKRIVLDFNSIPGLAELCVELSRKLKTELLNDNKDEQKQKLNIRYLLEILSSRKTLLILKDTKSWLNEDGTLNSHLKFFTDIIVSTDMFDSISIMTSSRYIEIPYEYYTKTQQIHIGGMDDIHIAQIISNNLPQNFPEDNQKSEDFAKRLYGYPLGAKFASYHIANHGYDYYLKQPQKIQTLKLSLAKQLISFANLSESCQDYLKILALCKSRLRNEEYCEAFPSITDQIAALADEAFFAGILKFDDDGCYKLEPLVEDYYYDLAFNSSDRKIKCNTLKDFLSKKLKNASKDKYFRLLPAAVHIFILDGDISGAFQLRSEFTATVTESMWDQYNHGDYEETLITANGLLSVDSENKEALYIRALCLTRFDECDEAEEILNQLLEEDSENAARYYYALGRIQKRKSNYKKAIEFFKIATIEKTRYISPYREMAECYIHLGELSNAETSINLAKKIDDSNIFVILLEAFLLQKQGKAEQSIELLSNISLLNNNPAQICFRIGRAYDQLGKSEEAQKYYNDALNYNSNMYDAKLCLLSHQIIESPESAKIDIEELKGKLKGKRRAILTNIEARLVGYVEQNTSAALSLLESVSVGMRDKQWYAVKIQLLQKEIEVHILAQRTILAEKIQNKLSKLKNEYEQKFGEFSADESNFLPDA